MTPHELVEISREVLEYVPEGVAREESVIPLRIEGRALQVAYAFERYADPGELHRVRRRLRRWWRSEIALVPLRQADVEEAIARHYRQGRIEHCPLGVTARFRCPKLWQSLVPTEDASIRYCAECQQPVYFCLDREQRIAHANAGHCIAFEQPGRQAVTMGLYMSDSGLLRIDDRQEEREN